MKEHILFRESVAELLQVLQNSLSLEEDITDAGATIIKSIKHMEDRKWGEWAILALFII